MVSVAVVFPSLIMRMRKQIKHDAYPLRYDIQGYEADVVARDTVSWLSQ